MELFIFNQIFIVECTLKLLGLGLRNYLEEAGNVLDLVLTVISTTLIAIYWADLSGYDNSSTVELGVGVRLIRSVSP